MKKQQLDVSALSQNSGINPEELKRYLSNLEPLTNPQKLSRLATALNTPLPQLLSSSPVIPELTPDEKQLLIIFRQLSPDKQEILQAFIKGCQYSYI